MYRSLNVPSPSLSGPVTPEGRIDPSKVDEPVRCYGVSIDRPVRPSVVEGGGYDDRFTLIVLAKPGTDREPSGACVRQTRKR